MKVKDFIEQLETYDPEYEMMITLPPGWYNEEDVKNRELWNKEGWTLDSIDYVLISDKSKIVSICPVVYPEGVDVCILL